MNNPFRILACGLIALFAAAMARADRDADRRNERIPPGHRMHAPRHQFIRPLGTTGPTGFTPQQLRHAYGFDQLATTGQGQVIAIVDAYGSPTIQADLDTFCAALNIPSATVRVFYPQGQPAVNSGWGAETSLDVEWAHAIAPGATIVVVAAQSAATSDLLAAVDYAVGLGANEVSMSWGGSEYSTEAGSDYHFNVAGVTFAASAGDSGAGVEFPSCSPYVVGVGGTTLTLDGSYNITAEKVWSGSGGGASAYQPVPGFQAGWWNGTTRGVPDVAYDANPNTGVPVYQTGPGWAQYGGTSMSAPQWAALCALANSLRAQPLSATPAALYALANANYAGDYRDITAGNNGYAAGTGYDLASGLGTPKANVLVPALAGGFAAQAAAPVFFPGAGAYSGAQSVTLVSASSGVSIRYTTDGSAPSETTGTLYSGAIAISTATTLKAIAYGGGVTDSAVTTGAYAFIPQAAAPVFSPAAGTYANPQTVTITSATGGASIRYATDGSTPTETTGTLYSGPIAIGNTGPLQAVAYGGGLNDSAMTGGVYTITSPAGSLNVIYNFTTSQKGATYPRAGLIQGADGNFYGTTISGGSAGDGTVFKITPAGVLTALFSFSGANGSNPGRLIQGTDGNFYGTTLGGGSAGDGTVYKLTPAGALTTLLSFKGTNGNQPIAALVQGADGNFYGTTYGGGGGSGTVFKITPAGVLTTLVSFSSNTSGGSPYGGLVQGVDGNFYGTTSSGGTGTDGTIFKMTPAGGLTVLVALDGTQGKWPDTSLILGGDGNFYGTTSGGGSANGGTVFKLTPAGVMTTLAAFDGANGIEPSTLVQGTDGNFYGTTLGGGGGSDGTIFRVTPAGVLTALISLDGTNGTEPADGLIQASDGKLYGTAEWGGTSDVGVVFQVSLAQTAAPAFSPAPGAYFGAQTVGISSTTNGASIRYTTDGGTPSETNGTLYTVPVAINGTTTLQAIAYENGISDSKVTSGTYTIILPAAAPVFSPSAGTYAGPQSVTITSATGGVTIRYTTDGSVPSETTGTLYSGAITLNLGTTNLRAIAYESGYSDSTVTGGTYTINAIAPVITTAPSDVTVAAGGGAGFTAAASGYPAPTWQWSFNGAALADGTQSDGSVVSGSATGSLSLGNLKLAESGAYTVTATNSGGSVSASATLTVTDNFLSFVSGYGLDPATTGAPSANPSGDGISNLLKFVLGGDPTVADRSILPTSNYTTVSDQPVLVYVYNQTVASIPVVTATVQYSTDLSNWTTAVDGVNGVTIRTTALDGATNQVTVAIPAGAGLLFARLHLIH